jgi:hypothetical protein
LDDGSSITVNVAYAARLGAAQSKKSLNLANPVTDTTDAFALSYSPNGMVRARESVTVGNGTTTGPSAWPSSSRTRASRAASVSTS